MSHPDVRATPRTSAVRAIAVLLPWAVAAAVFFRRPIFSGFAFVTGENGDTRLIIYLHEHWVLVLRGLASWRDPGFFYPAGDTLGYSDTFVLDEVFYAPLRWLGVDTFGAYQWTLLLLSLVGYVGAYRLLRQVLAGQPLLCSGLAAVFTFSNMLYVQSGHTQLYAIYWVPGIVVLVLRAAAKPAAAAGPAFLAGLVTGLLYLSTFYVAFFCTLCCVVWLAVGWALQRAAHRDCTARPVRDSLRRHRTALTAGCVGAAVGGVPFLLVYLPNFGSSRGSDVVLDYAAEPRDILNTGARNFLWGPPTRALFGASRRLGNGELAFGLTPTLLAGLLVATVHLVRRFRGEAGDRSLLGVALATAVTCWTAIALPVKVFGWSLWYPVWLLVPGARAIRAIDRLGVVASLLAPLVVAFVIADLLRRTAREPLLRRRILLGAAALTVLLVVEQVNVGHNATLDRTEQTVALQAVPAPPQSCRIFYLTGVRAPAPLAYLADIDAMLIAQQLTSRGTPVATINGFSGNAPDGFGDAADPGSSGYAEAVRAWVAQHHITSGLCSYDQVRRQWQVQQP